MSGLPGEVTRVRGSALIGLSMRAYPRSFRERFAGDMQASADEALLDARRQGRLAWLGTLIWWCIDSVFSGLGERRFRSAEAAGAASAVRRAGVGRMLWTDVRQSFRRLRRSPGFSAVVTITLGLGLGLTTLVFHVVNALLIRPLEYPESDRLVRIHMVGEAGSESSKVSGADAADWSVLVPSLDGVALIDFGAVAVAGGSGEPEYVRTLHASHALFEVLGTGPSLGRGFEVADDIPGSAGVVILSASFWRRRFAGDPAVLGRTLLVQGRPHAVIGVLPDGFEEPSTADSGQAEVFLPLRLDAVSGQRGSRWLTAIARLAAGTTMERADDELAATAAVLSTEYPETNSGLTARPVGLHEALWGDTRSPLLLLLVGAGFILLIACVNLANLVFARGTVRQRDVAIRRAIGAGRGQVIRQLLIENVVLAVGSGIVGLGLTVFVSVLLRSFVSVPRLTAPPDQTVVAFAAGLTLLAALLIGMLPALGALRSDPSQVLNEGGRGMFAGRRARRVRNVLAGGQMALALVLLVGAALMLRSFARLVAVDPGFDVHSALTWELTLPSMDYADSDGVVAFQSALIERLESIPGVVAAGAVDKFPFGSRWGCGNIAIEGRSLPQRAEDWPCAESRVVTSGYANSLGIALRRGRMIEDSDDGLAEPVVVVNETFASATWPGEPALGRRIAWARDTRGETLWRTVVGVLADVRHRGLDAAPLPEVYMPYRQSPDRRMSFVVRSVEGADPALLAPAVRSAIRQLDPVLPLRDVRTLDETVARSVDRARAGVLTLAGLGVLALLLAVSGIYGVLAYFVAQRMPEFGLRIALGAGDREIARLVLTEGLRTATAGAAIGLVVYLAGAGQLRGLLFDVSPTDPLALGSVTLLLIGVAALASWLPARRALAVDPTVALRAD